MDIAIALIVGIAVGGIVCFFVTACHLIEERAKNNDIYNQGYNDGYYDGLHQKGI